MAVPVNLQNLQLGQLDEMYTQLKAEIALQELAASSLMTSCQSCRLEDFREALQVATEVQTCHGRVALLEEELTQLQSLRNDLLQWINGTHSTERYCCALTDHQGITLSCTYLHVYTLPDHSKW